MFSGIKSIIFGYSEPATDNGAPTTDDIVVQSAESSDHNDSSDIADMDESWYVIPPPCFTGANKFDETVKPKAKEADSRENALIEHPSMYIASTSNRNLTIGQKQAKPTSTNKKTTEPTLAKQKVLASKKANKQVVSAAEQSFSPNFNKRKSVAISVPSIEKKNTKAWDKKLNWIYEKDDALIEHPSIYIASTSNSNLIERKQNKPTTANRETTEPIIAKQKVVASKKVNKQVVSVAEQPLCPNLNSRKSVAISVPSIEKKNTKAWDKKLNWTRNKEVALIDHASIYIASTANRDLIEHKQNESTPTVDESTEVVLVEQKATPSKKGSKQVTSVAEQSFSSDRNKRKSAPMAAQPIEKTNTKAWENKFIVTSWDDEEQNDLNDFDNLFDNDELVQFPPKAKKSKAKRQQMKRKPIEAESCDSFENMSASFESSNFSIPPSPTPALVEDELSIETVSGSIESCSPVINENILEKTRTLGRRQSKVSHSERKAPIPVRPIEPERQPSWLLKKVRAKRRPLSTVFTNNTCRVSPVERYDRPMVALRKVKTLNEAPPSSSRPIAIKGSPAASPSSSARSSPTIINRIGSSIAVNLNILTAGFPAGPVPAMQQARATMEETEKLSQAVVRKASIEFNQAAHRRLSKSYLARHNDCVRLANTHKRVDRRKRMHITPNGISVNRKVQTNFH